MANDYGADPGDLDSVNAVGGECGCCDFPECPTPTWEWRSKTATLSFWYDHDDVTLSADPTQCAALWGKFFAYEIVYAYSVTDTLPTADVGLTERIRTYSCTLTYRRENNPFTGTVTEIHSGSGTFKNEDWSTESDGGGGYQWKASPDYSETWTVTSAGDGSEWEWDYSNSDTDTDSGVFDGISGAAQNINGALDTIWTAGGPDVDETSNTSGWSAGDYVLTFDDSTETRTLADEWTKTTLEAAATTYFGTIGYDSEMVKTDAARTVTHPTTSGGCTDEDHIDTWEEVIVGYRITIPAAHNGDSFQVDWDEAEQVGAAVTLTAKQATWSDPDSKTLAWSADMKMTAGNYGIREVANVRFTCYGGDYGAPPKHDPTFDTLAAT